MKLRFYLLMVCITMVSFCKGQYIPFESDSANQQVYSRSQIRQQFLDMGKASQPQVYRFAKQSRRSTTWSVIFYSVGALYTIGGLVGLSNVLNGVDPYGTSSAAAIVGLGVGTVGLSLGTWQAYRARNRLDRAIKLYEN